MDLQVVIQIAREAEAKLDQRLDKNQKALQNDLPRNMRYFQIIR